MATPQPLDAPAGVATPMAVAPMEDRKRSLRFTLATDIVLLQEVNRHKPWASPHGKIRDTWQQIATAVTAVINEERDPNDPPARVDHGASKRRFDILMEAFAKDELKSMRAKGSVELYVQREALLTDLSLQLSQFQEQKIKVKKQVVHANGDAAVAAAIAASPYTGMKRAEPSSAAMLGGHIDIKRQAMAMAPVAGVTANAPPRLIDDMERVDDRELPLIQLRTRELELAEKRLELDRAHFESEREERAAVVAAMQANTTLLLRLVERLERSPTAQVPPGTTAGLSAGAGVNAFTSRQI